jgi:glucose/arabinose dehydrogenase
MIGLAETARLPIARGPRLAVGVLASLVLVAGACSSGEDSGSPEITSSTMTTRAGSTNDDSTHDDATVEPALVSTGAELDSPTDAHPGHGSLLVALRAGKVVELTADDDGGYEIAGTVIDLTDQVGSTEAEKGLLGVTTDASGEHLYVNHTRADDGATVIVEFPLEGEPGSLSAGERRQLLVIDQPFPNHNGGDLAWGPDNMLWIGTGDGGAADDPDGRAQRLTDPLGKVLRLDPSLDGAGEDLAPADNPYADGTDGAGDEANALIWARGVRNPWRISFDSATGDLWIADVGQNEIEEVTVLRADDQLNPGADLGWDRYEGDSEFADPGPRVGWPEDDASVIEPLFTYTHEQGCSISGGFVYHGSALPQLENRYLFSDYCNSEIRSVNQGGEHELLGLTGTAVVSINADENGEPLVLDSEGIRRIAAR